MRLRFCLAILLVSGAIPALASTPQYTDILPISRIKPGMKGYGLTTFHGVTISRFNVTVIGVLKNANAGHDLILIRMKGGPITERGANLIHGMSGSPIYINGKIIGAFSQGEQWPKEPVGMVTPIQDMLEAWDPNIPQKPAYFQPTEQKSNSIGITLPHAVYSGSRRITRIVPGAPSSQSSTGSTAVLHYATSYLYAPGAREANCLWLQKALEQKGFHYTVVADGGVSGAAQFHGAPLKPGSCFGTMLATGDIPFGGYGTLTYRKGDRVLGFGHPLMGLGALEGAITSAYVVDVFSGLQTSHLIPMAGPVVGTLRQDRDFSVSGDLSSRPRLVPFEVTVNDATTHRSQTFHERLLQHPDLTAQLMTFVAKEAIARVHDIPGDVMARVTTTVDAAEIGTLTRTNTVYDASDLSGPALMDLSEITGIVSGNPFYPLPIKSGKITIDIRAGHETATIERIFLKQGKFEPGDTLDIGVVLKPYRLPEFTRSISLKIPQNTPGGRYTLAVRGGMATLMRFGGVSFGGGGDPTTPPANVKQLSRQISEREANSDIVARILLNTYAPAVEGLKLSQLPPNLEALMRSERNSGVRLEREDVRCTVPAGYVVSGSQQLTINIVRSNNQELPSSGLQHLPTGSGGGSGLTPTSLPPLGSPGGADIEESASGLAAAPTLPPDVMAYSLVRDYGLRPDAHERDQENDKLRSGPGSGQDRQPADSGAKPPANFRVIEPDKPADLGSTSATELTGKMVKPDKPVGRQPAVWRQSARSDFAGGQFTGTGISVSGELRLSPVLTRLATSSETYIWTLVSDGHGILYAGTGTTGKILKIDSSGHVSVLAELPVVAVQTLLLAHDGTLWAGTGPTGALYHVSLDGRYTLACVLNEHFILSLAEDSKGCLYIGAGGSGNIYRLTSAQLHSSKPITSPRVFFKTTGQHVLALAIDSGSDGSILAGAAPEGILYRISPDGRGKALYDTRDNAIMAIATPCGPAGKGKSGDIYIATGPRGSVYAVHADGSATTLYDHAPMFFTALKSSPDGSLFASTAASIYHITPAGDNLPAMVVPLDNTKEVDYLCLAVMPNGTVAAGTGNVGEVFVSSNTVTAARLTGTYESVVRDAKLRSQWGTIRWDGSVPESAVVRVSTRSGDVEEPDGTWSGWSPARAIDGAGEGKVTSPPARYIQYRLELAGASSIITGSPAVREVSLSYMPKNQAPKVAFLNPNSEEQWSHTQTIRWSASDPDNDTLTYTLEYSPDNGATWHAVVAAAIPSPTLPLPPSPRPPVSPSPASTQRDTFRTWDTMSVPDGRYLLRVSASDGASNPTDPLSAVTVSSQVIVCNSAPVVRISGKPKVQDDRCVLVNGVATQALAAVTAVQYRIDSGDWISATAADGLFDSGREAFQFVTAPLARGIHTIEVLGFNSAGARSSINIEVNTP